jgi:hypothetical protein
MIMKTGQRWHCTNPVCRCEVLVQSPGEVEGNNPRCVCGAAMKKEYTPPNLTYLEFLRIDETAPAPQPARKS